MACDDPALCQQVKALIVRCARLKIAPDSIGNETLLFDPKGLALDSIDVLELVVNLERSFGVTIQDRETGQRVLASVSTIVGYIKETGNQP